MFHEQEIIIPTLYAIMIPRNKIKKHLNSSPLAFTQGLGGHISKKLFQNYGKMLIFEYVTYETTAD
jgi:hypothetical protein